MTSQEILLELGHRHPVLLPVLDDVGTLFDELCATYRRGGKLLVAGNGGSAADAEHIVGELMKGFLLPRPLDAALCEKLIAADPVRGEALAKGLQGTLPAISLCGEHALSTAVANDGQPYLVFAQPVRGFGNEGDLFLAISTSGNAENLLFAAAVAHAKGMRVALLTGRSGGKLIEVADLAVCAPADQTFAVQELHLPIYHALCRMLEAEFFGER